MGQRDLPECPVLELLGHPRGADFPLKLKPIPPLCPDPPGHSLDVKDNPRFFGDLKVPALQLQLEEEEVEKVEQEKVVESLTYKEPWTLPKSVFAPRVRESDAKDFHDTEKVTERMCGAPTFPLCPSAALLDAREDGWHLIETPTPGHDPPVWACLGECGLCRARVVASRWWCGCSHAYTGCLDGCICRQV